MFTISEDIFSIHSDGSATSNDINQCMLLSNRIYGLLCGSETSCLLSQHYQDWSSTPYGHNIGHENVGLFHSTSCLWQFYVEAIAQIGGLAYLCHCIWFASKQRLIRPICHDAERAKARYVHKAMFDSLENLTKTFSEYGWCTYICEPFLEDLCHSINMSWSVIWRCHSSVENLASNPLEKH